MVFNQNAATVGEVIEMILRDFPVPTYGWGCGVCQACPEHRVETDGAYAATIYTQDYSPGGMALALTNGGIAPVEVPSKGWMVGCHGGTPGEALSKAYGLAMEKVA